MDIVYGFVWPGNRNRVLFCGEEEVIFKNHRKVYKKKKFNENVWTCRGSNPMSTVLQATTQTTGTPFTLFSYL